MDSGKKTIRELFKVVCIDGVDFIAASDVEKYIKQQQELTESSQKVQDAVNMLNRSLSDIQLNTKKLGDSLRNFRVDKKER